MIWQGIKLVPVKTQGKAKRMLFWNEGDTNAQVGKFVVKTADGKNVVCLNGSCGKTSVFDYMAEIPKTQEVAE